MQGAPRPPRYASLDSDSEDSIKRLTRVLGTYNVFAVVEICADMLDIMFTQVTAVAPLIGG